MGPGHTSTWSFNNFEVQSFTASTDLDNNLNNADADLPVSQAATYYCFFAHAWKSDDKVIASELELIQVQAVLRATKDMKVWASLFTI